MINLEFYRVFYTVARCGSLTKAAQELFISQPAVSQSVKQFENQLGVNLFNRTHRGMDLSAAGKLIFKQVEEALNLLDDAESKVSELKTTATGRIRIGATDSIFSHFLSDKLAAFNEKYPAVKLELISSTSPYTLSQLKEGRCDIAFINLPLDDDDVNFYGTVGHLNDAFVAGAKYEHLKGVEISLESLRDYPLMFIEENTVARKALSAFCENLGISLAPDTEVANWDLMKKLVIKGMGLGCIPREYCLDEFASGELIELSVCPPLPARGIGIVIAKHAALSYAMKEFLKLFDGV
ncbi:MAG: LysR family transcriptional regulator [Clostridia bacterium]|nr:LysR family transcriptional regulator [Clostridia bacterium]